MPQKLQKFPLLDTFIWYLTERWSIHQKRLKSLPPPWTDDFALQKYRFCQVRREDDRVTRWIHENWLQPHADDPDLWHAMCVARVGFNLPATLEYGGWPEPWGRRGRIVMEAARKRKASGLPMITGAYIIATHGSGDIDGQGRRRPLVEYMYDVLNGAWQERAVLCPRVDDTLQSFHTRLAKPFGFGLFTAGQVVADMKHAAPLRDATDWFTFAVSGPGSLKGLNLVCGRELNQRWRETDWHTTLLEVRKVLLPSLPRPLRDLDAQNIEHGLCELFKWHRIQNGGRSKQSFSTGQSDYFKETR